MIKRLDNSMLFQSFKEQLKITIISKYPEISIEMSVNYAQIKKSEMILDL